MLHQGSVLPLAVAGHLLRGVAAKQVWCLQGLRANKSWPGASLAGLMARLRMLDTSGLWPLATPGDAGFQTLHKGHHVDPRARCVQVLSGYPRAYDLPGNNATPAPPAIKAKAKKKGAAPQPRDLPVPMDKA